MALRGGNDVDVANGRKCFEGSGGATTITQACGCLELVSTRGRGLVRF